MFKIHAKYQISDFQKSKFPDFSQKICMCHYFGTDERMDPV